MDSGWVKIHRKLLENPFMRKPAYVSLWLTLLLKANHKAKEFMWNKGVILVQEGQMITGRKQLSLETGIPESTIEDILKYLENQHQIQQQKENKYRLITIVNWKTYQNSDNTFDRKATTKQQQTDTNKNVKNDKNIDTDTSLSILKELPKELLLEMVERFKCDESQVKVKANALFDYCESKGKRYKNYKAFLSNALRRDYGERPPKVEVPKYEIINGKAVLVSK